MFKKLLIAAMFALAACSGPAPAYAAINLDDEIQFVQETQAACLSPDIIKMTLIPEGQTETKVYIEIVDETEILKFKQHLSMILDQPIDVFDFNRVLVIESSVDKEQLWIVLFDLVNNQTCYTTDFAQNKKEFDAFYEGAFGVEVNSVQ